MARRVDRAVQNTMIKYSKLIIVAIFVLGLTMSNYSLASGKFTSEYSCSDTSKECVIKGGTKMVDGFPIYKDCWGYSYNKTCNYPSKDNCKLYEHCYLVDNKRCLLKDSLGNCVNMEKEFSCKRWEPENKENQIVRMDFEAKDGQEGLVCKGIPCIDGNCVDKSYMTNGEMMDSLSKLYATSNMKPDGEMNFKLFEGFGSHCSKKVAEYSNCCQIKPKGWGKELGMKCGKDEQDLAERRLKNLCVYVGQTKTKKIGVTTVTKEHFCCFGNMLEKVVQVEGRKQLGINFGKEGKPDCRGLTLEEIQKLDFSKMDFTDFINELLVKFTGSYKAPNQKEIASRIESSMGNIRKYDNNPKNQANNMTGWSGAVKDDSWETQEEKRLEELRISELAKENLRKQEEIKRQQELEYMREKLNHEILNAQSNLKNYQNGAATWDPLKAPIEYKNSPIYIGKHQRYLNLVAEQQQRLDVLEKQLQELK